MKTLAGLNATCGALLGLLVAASTAGVTQAATIGEQITQGAQVGDAVPAAGLDSLSRMTLKFSDGVTGVPGVTYQTLSGYRPMKLDLFMPPASFDKVAPRPWVMFIHGGGWVEGDPRRSGAFRDWPNVLASLAARGYVVASVGYRFAREAPSPAAIQDVKAAIRFLKANATSYHLDPARGMTWGVSAGGQLAALAGTSCGVKAFEPPARSVPDRPNVEVSASAPVGADEVSDCVQGVVSWYGVSDLAAAYAGSQKNAGAPVPNVIALLLDCDGPCRADQLRNASPITYVDANDPPVLLMHGTDDQTVNPEQSKAFDAVLKAAGVRSTLVMIPGVGHSWIGRTPEATHHASKLALQTSIDFIQSTIGDSATRTGSGQH